MLRATYLYVYNSTTEFYRNKLSQKTVVECQALSVVSQDLGWFSVILFFKELGRRASVFPKSP
jgi:hypothetical protein